MTGLWAFQSPDGTVEHVYHPSPLEVGATMRAELARVAAMTPGERAALADEVAREMRLQLRLARLAARQERGRG